MGPVVATFSPSHSRSFPYCTFHMQSAILTERLLEFSQLCR